MFFYLANANGIWECLCAVGSVLCCESGASRYAARALAAYRSLVFARPLIRATRALSPWGPAGTGTGTGTASAERELPDTTPSSEPQLFHTSLGTHGLTAGGDGQLVSLHAALRDELHAHQDAYKQALHKIHELSAVTAVAAPAQSSHQRLLALRAGEVEQRLIDNASLLAAVQRAPPRLPALAAALAARVRCDKQALAAAGLARRAMPAPHVPPHEDTRPVAGVLMSYSRGCATLLALMTGGAPPAAPRPRHPRHP
ncbi:hypothetical protein MSG28_014357, partial [Choristoneura fumiferana]